MQPQELPVKGIGDKQMKHTQKNHTLYTGLVEA